jgi:hypothetical protein
MKEGMILVFQDFYGTLEQEVNDRGIGTMLLHPGQKARLLNWRCRKTGRRSIPDDADSDLQMRFGDKGFFLNLEIIGGPADGVEIEYLDSANDWGDEEQSTCH